MTEPEPPAIRRNGLLQSCEPCRKSKLKCDHGRPVCGRCIAKSITQRCFYHPAPMTKQESPVPAPGQRQAKRPRTESSKCVCSDNAERMTADLILVARARRQYPPCSMVCAPRSGLRLRQGIWGRRVSQLCLANTALISRSRKVVVTLIVFSPL